MMMRHHITILLTLLTLAAPEALGAGLLPEEENCGIGSYASVGVALLLSPRDNIHPWLPLVGVLLAKGIKILKNLQHWSTAAAFYYISSAQVSR